MTDRLEIRLDTERRRKLEQLAESRHATISDLVRALLDREYDEWLRDERLRAARLISSLAAEDVPEPEELDRQLNETYDTDIC